MLKLLRDLIDDMGECAMFIRLVARTAFRHPCSYESICEQIWKVTLQSLPTTALAGFFVGAIMTVQFTLQIKTFGALGYLGGLSTSGTVREVGPLLIAFLLSGKVGAFTSAELGTMRVTEQIDAIRCLGANPIQELILPRYIGIVVSSFFLLAAGLLMSISGGIVLGALFAGINPDQYVRHIPTIVTKFSIVSGLFKCLVFALILASVCTYKGWSTSGGAKGVGRSVVSTAVMTMVGIVVADWLTSLLNETALEIYLGRVL
ncbi:MAG: MlaE family ABC transporter permease [Bdellovibrionales bacterium]